MADKKEKQTHGNMSNQEFVSTIINLQKNVSGVEITGSTREVRIAKMKTLFSKNSFDLPH